PPAAGCPALRPVRDGHTWPASLIQDAPSNRRPFRPGPFAAMNDRSRSDGHRVVEVGAELADLDRLLVRLEPLVETLDALDEPGRGEGGRALHGGAGVIEGLFQLPLGQVGVGDVHAGEVCGTRAVPGEGAKAV